MATNKPRYTITVSDEMFKAIDDFRFENRFNTRSEATAVLIKIGLEAVEERLRAQQEKEKEQSGTVLREGEEI